MSFKKVDYNKTIIYKIVCKDLSVTEIYIGSTINFRQRKSHHKSSCNNSSSNTYNYILYEFIREHGGWDNFEMIEIEKYPCNDGNEARARERYYIELLNAKLNKVQRPFVTVEEQKVKAKERKQKEQYKENQKIYRNTLSEERKAEIQLRDKERKQSEYYKNYMKEYRKQYTVEHRDKINGKKREKIICSCGVTISKASKSKHLISQKHIEYMNKSS